MRKSRDISDNEFNAEKERKISESDSDPYRKPRSSSFKDADQFVYRAGAFVRDDSDDGSQSRSGSDSMPNFRNAIKAQFHFLQKFYFSIYSYLKSGLVSKQ